MSKIKKYEIGGWVCQPFSVIMSLEDEDDLDTIYEQLDEMYDGQSCEVDYVEELDDEDDQ